MKRHHIVILIGVVSLLMIVAVLSFFGGLISFGPEQEEVEGALWVMKVDGTELQPVTESCQVRTPLWSEKEHLLAYQTDGGRWMVKDIGHPEKGQVTISGFFGTSSELKAGWSPDGSHIAYFDFEGLIIKELGGAKPPKVPDVTFSKLVALDWSPDGSELAYIYNPQYFTDDDTELYILDIASSEQKLVAIGSGYDSVPYWSPDGDILFLENFLGNRIPGKLVLDEIDIVKAWPVNTFGGATSVFYRIIWSPGSNSIAYSIPHSDEDLANPGIYLQQRIYVAQLTGNPQEVQSGMIELLGWNGEGTGVIYYERLNGNDQLFEAAIDGSSPALLAEIPMGGIDPALSSDGRYLAFVVPFCKFDNDVEKIDRAANWRDRGAWIMADIQKSLSRFDWFGILCVQSVGSVMVFLWYIKSASSSRKPSRRFKWFAWLFLALSIFLWIVIVINFLNSLEGIGGAFLG